MSRKTDFLGKATWPSSTDAVMRGHFSLHAPQVLLFSLLALAVLR
jgi:hypothetical protein